MALSFRSAASTTARRYSGVITAALMAASYSLATTPTLANEPIAPACRTAGDKVAQLKCSVRLSQEATRAANARGAAADAEIAASDKRIAEANRQITANKKISEAAQASKVCSDNVTKDIQAAVKIGPLTPDQVRSFETRIADCNKKAL